MPFALGQVGELADHVDRAGVGRAAHGRDANGSSPAARSSATASATASPRSRNRSSDGTTRSVVGREPQDVQRARDREVRLVARRTRARPQLGAARRAVQAAAARRRCTSRATVSAMMFAITPPDVSTPHAPSP